MDQWIKSYLKTIRSHCDIIEQRLERQAEPVDSDKVLDYVLKHLELIEDDIDTFLNKPGRKSYLTMLANTRSRLAYFRRQVRLWREHELVPEEIKGE